MTFIVVAGSNRNVFDFRTCPNTASLEAEKVRRPMRQLLGTTAARPAARLRPLNDPRQIHALSDMGISVLTLPDGRVQLLYTTSTVSNIIKIIKYIFRIQVVIVSFLVQAKSAKDAAEGLTFMREMSKWNSMSDMENGVVPAGVKINDKIFPAGPGHFGKEISSQDHYVNNVAYVTPIDACSPIENKNEVEGKFGIAKRGQCTFAQKVRNMQTAGVTLAIILDNVPDSTHESTALFAMSGDGKDEIDIPAVFLFSQEGRYLTEAFEEKPDLVVTVSELKALKSNYENSCDDGKCETVLQTPGVANDKESFDHLKKVLSQLAAQFELSLSSDDQKTCGEESEDVFSKTKDASEEKNTEEAAGVCETTAKPKGPAEVETSTGKATAEGSVNLGQGETIGTAIPVNLDTERFTASDQVIAEDATATVEVITDTIDAVEQDMEIIKMETDVHDGF